MDVMRFILIDNREGKFFKFLMMLYLYYAFLVSVSFSRFVTHRSSHPDEFLRKGIRKICRKFTAHFNKAHLTKLLKQNSLKLAKCRIPLDYP